MCGFAGFRLLAGSHHLAPDDLLLLMGKRLQHRGPDGSGQWFDAGTGLGFCHRRLSIQDVSSSGAQPMTSGSGRYVIVFNGEIYNFLELKEQLPSMWGGLRGHSDTEVMLACFDAWGVRRAIDRFEGMFAFAVADREEGRLYLVRDRLGEKPLYYGWQRHGTLVFGSELKALRCHPHFDDEIDRNSLALLLRHNYIPAPGSIYKSVRKLEPGCLLAVDLDGDNQAPAVERYWSLPDCYRHTESKPASRNELMAELEEELKRSVRQQMIADVPLGAFLSGGVDSSTVVALMQEQSSIPVRTFSIGFHEEAYDEAGYAKSVASHLGTDHTELYASASDALDIIPFLSEIYDEPFADSSQLPTYMVCRMARKDVTVALSGDGGDELFCGYDRFYECIRGWNSLLGEGIQGAVQRLVLQHIPHMALAPVVRLLAAGRDYPLNIIVDKLHRHEKIRSSASLRDYYRNRISYWPEPLDVVTGADDVTTVYGNFPVHEYTTDEYAQLMLLDSLCYLPDDILVKVDRAAMANSLETRIPFLNHRIVELAASIPSAMHRDGTVGKQLLRNILYKYVPEKLIERPKKGFAVPLQSWLRGPLRGWAEAHLDSRRLAEQGYFDSRIITRKWREHLQGDADHSFQLWGVLSFQAWLESQSGDTARG